MTNGLIFCKLLIGWESCHLAREMYFPNRFFYKKICTFFILMNRGTLPFQERALIEILFLFLGVALFLKVIGILYKKEWTKL